MDLTKTSAVESAIAIQKAAEEHLSQLIPDLCKSDLEVAELEKQIKEFMLNKKKKVNDNSKKKVQIIQSYEIEKDEFTDGRQKSGKTSLSKNESSDDHSIAIVCVLQYTLFSAYFHKIHSTMILF